ncbi:MAG: hypothetical protein FJW37_03015, partial [Acidobacteria bacterium]|nr:hypothetical protein [Acidobacteriota bacterium]
DSCDLIRSQFALLQDFEAGVALDYMAEISEQLLPPAEPNERHYRLLVAVLDHIRAGAQAPLNAEMNREAAGPVPTSSPAGEGNVWRAVTYFTLWAVRLAGFLPQPEDLRGVSEESRRIAAEMLRRPVAEVAPAAWTRRTASDLRRFLVRQIESHIERKLLAAKALEAA